MTTPIRLSLLTCLIAAGALLSSCAYDPYHSRTSSSVTYSSDRGVSTTTFIRTGSSRWGYDPHCHSYYDYHRKCYYDPYLRGYYPRGYRPPVIVGVPHPHGWRRGRNICPPPRNVRDHYIRDHRQRHQQYRRLNHSWARDLRGPGHSNRHHVRNNRHTPAHSNSIWNRGQHPTHQLNRHNRGRDHRGRIESHPNRIQPDRGNQHRGHDRSREMRRFTPHNTAQSNRPHSTRQITPTRFQPSGPPKPQRPSREATSRSGANDRGRGR